jgi:general nucleoside transport system permease protein
MRERQRPVDDASGLGWWGVPLALLAGAIRTSTPFLFVSLGECLTEKSGRINLGLEGNLVLGAMVAYGASYLSGSPWLGVLVAAAAGSLLGALHAFVCSRPRVNDIAVGIAIMLLGTGLAFFFGKPFVEPQAPMLPDIPLGWWSNVPQLRSAFNVNPLFIAGVLSAPVMSWFFSNTRWGLEVRTVGDSEDAARSIGLPIDRLRLFSTMVGGAFAGVGGAFLSLYYPGSWNEGLSSGQGLIAVALVIFSRWDPVRCLYASLLFGAAGALGPALQSVGIVSGYYLFNAAPYVLTLVVMVATCSPTKSLAGAPGELSVTR